MSVDPLIEARVYVSWDGSATFTGPHDDVTSDTAGEPGLVVDSGRDAALTLAPPKVSGGSFELRNDDGVYSQHRADSPLYQRVLPGRPVRYEAHVGTTDAYDSPTPYDENDYYDGRAAWPLGAQLVDAIEQTTEWGNRRVRLRTIGHEVLFTDAVITVPMQVNIRTDQAVRLVLAACGWPESLAEIAVSDTTLSWWWVDEQSAWTALLALAGAEGPGTFYVDRAGVFHWENRNYRTITPRAMTSQATLYDHRVDGASWFETIQYDPGYQQLRNRATYATTRRAPGTLAQVWQYGVALSLAPNETQTLIARPSAVFINAVTPLVGTDYTLTAGTATVTLASSSGFVAYLTVVAGPSGATIAGPPADPTKGVQLRAQPLAVVSETVVQNNVDASASIATFSPIPGAAIPIPLSVQGWAEIDPSAGVAVCNAWVSRYKEARPTITILVPAVNQAQLDQVVQRTVSDRITLVETNTGLHHDAWINTLEVRIHGAGGRAAELLLGCELCDTVSGATWNSAVWDVSVWGV